MQYQVGRLWACVVLLVGLVGAADAANLVTTNPGFEIGSTSSWQVYNGGGGAVSFTVTSSPTKVHSGRFAGKISGYTGTGPLRIINGAWATGLPPGTLVRMRIYVMMEDVTYNPASGYLTVLLIAYKQGSLSQGVWGNGYFAGSTNGYVPIECLLQVPPGADRLDVHVGIDAAMAAGTIYIDDLTIEPVSPGPVSQDIPDCRLVRDSGNTPRLVISGTVTSPNFVFVNPGGNRHTMDQVALAGQVGVNLVQISMSLPWEGVSSGFIENIAALNPNAYVLPRIQIYAPAYWLDSHPDQLVLDQDGNPLDLEWTTTKLASLASDQFINDVKQQITYMVQYFHNSPYKDRIMGYHFIYLQTGEWFYTYLHSKFVDYSEINRQRFILWLRTRYANNIETLNAAWHTSYTTFAQVVIPPAADWRAGDDGVFRDPSTQRAVSGYQEYHNQLTADRLIELAQHVKTLTSGKSLMSYFYGYQNELIGNGYLNGIGHCGHLALRRVLDSPYVDILGGPISYYDRGVGGPSNMMSIVDSVALSGKMYLQEEDARTWLYPNPEPSLAYPTEWDTMQCLRRDYGNVICHNQATWWMDLSGQAAFNSPAIWSNNKILADTYADSINNQVRYEPEVALIYDEDTFFWLKADSYTLNINNGYIQRSVFQSLGAPVGYYLIDDLNRLPSSVKLIVFVNTWRITESEEAKINALKGGGRTLLWLYAPGYVGETSLSVNRMQELVGIPLKKHSGSMYATTQITNLTHSIGQGLTGHEFSNIGPISPLFYGEVAGTNITTLGTYTQLSKPSLLIRDFTNWKSIFCGSPVVSVPLLRSIAKHAGVKLLVDPDDLNATDAVQCNDRYIYVYARGRSGVRTFRLPAGIASGHTADVTEVVSGTTIGTGITTWTDNLSQNEQKIYKIVPR